MVLAEELDLTLRNSPLLVGVIVHIAGVEDHLPIEVAGHIGELVAHMKAANCMEVVADMIAVGCSLKCC